MAVIIFIVSFTNSYIFNSKWQIITLLFLFVKYLNRAASENFRSACFVAKTNHSIIDWYRFHSASLKDIAHLRCSLTYGHGHVILAFRTQKSKTCQSFSVWGYFSMSMTMIKEFNIVLIMIGFGISIWNLLRIVLSKKTVI